MIIASTTVPNDFPEERTVLVGRNPAATVGEVGSIAEQVEYDFSTATYRLNPIRATGDEIFISPIIRSVPVRLRVTARGWIDLRDIPESL